MKTRGTITSLPGASRRILMGLRPTAANATAPVIPTMTADVGLGVDRERRVGAMSRAFLRAMRRAGTPWTPAPRPPSLQRGTVPRPWRSGPRVCSFRGGHIDHARRVRSLCAHEPIPVGELCGAYPNPSGCGGCGISGCYGGVEAPRGLQGGRGAIHLDGAHLTQRDP